MGTPTQPQFPTRVKVSRTPIHHHPPLENVENVAGQGPTFEQVPINVGNLYIHVYMYMLLLVVAIMRMMIIKHTKNKQISKI